MTDTERKELDEKLVQLNAKLRERQASIPAHSIRPHQLIAIEELEEEIAEIERRLGSQDNGSAV